MSPRLRLKWVCHTQDNPNQFLSTVLRDVHQNIAIVYYIDNILLGFAGLKKYDC